MMPLSPTSGRTLRSASRTGALAGLFQRRFVNKHRVSPLQYPSIADQKFVPLPQEIHLGVKGGQPGLQVHRADWRPWLRDVHESVSEEQDSRSSSSDLTWASGTTTPERRCRTSRSKSHQRLRRRGRSQGRRRGRPGNNCHQGLSQHQFLNPAINRRTDDWGGSVDNRFRFLHRIVEAVRDRVGRDYLFGVRLSAADFNHSPLQLSRFVCLRSSGRGSVGRAMTWRRCSTMRNGCANSTSTSCTSSRATGF